MMVSGKMTKSMEVESTDNQMALFMLVTLRIVWDKAF